MQRAIHRFDTDATPTLRNPRVDSVDESGVRLSLGVLPEPVQVDDARIVSTTRLELHVTGLTITSEDATYRRSTYAEHLCSRVVRGRQTLAVRVPNASSQIERNIHPDF